MKGTTRTTEEVERYYAENPEQRGEPQRKQTKLRKVGAIVGWALLFWFVASISVGIGLTLLGVDQTGRSAFYLAALILGGLYGAGYRLRRPRTRRADDTNCAEGDHGWMKLLRYAATVFLGLTAVILLLLAALCVFVGVLVIVDPSYGDPTTIIFIPFGLIFLAAPGFALAWAAFRTWPRQPSTSSGQSAAA